jgi:hypothetical protein
VDRPQRLARRQEHRSAEFYGARSVPASGSGDVKGDAETDDELFEFKHTEGKSFSLVRRAWTDHIRHALLAGTRRAVWEVEYTDPVGRNPQYVVVLDRDDYQAMREELAALRSELDRLMGRSILR